MDTVEEAFARRLDPLAALGPQAEALALACRDLAQRFARGGRLLVFGNGTRTADAQHVAVEFVHPVVAGKRALPALSLAGDVATLLGVAASTGLDGVYAHQVAVLGRPDDIALGIGSEPSVRNGLAAARDNGLLTVALVGADGDVPADHVVQVPSADGLVVKEGCVTAYHLLWELVHVFLESPDAPVAESGVERLYPFLYGGGTDPDALLAAVAESARQKAAEAVELRRAFGERHALALTRCADDVAVRLGAGGTLLAFGNGGSSTDAQDLVHCFMDPPPGARPWPALGLTNDVAVVTALSNDVSFDVVFARQLRAFGRPGDVAVALSTSGGSSNVLAGLDEARAMGMLTVGLAGYGGGRFAQSPSVDHLLAVESTSVHRVQEVQTTVGHVLWEAVSERLRPPPARG